MSGLLAATSKGLQRLKMTYCFITTSQHNREQNRFWVTVCDLWGKAGSVTRQTETGEMQIRTLKTLGSGIYMGAFQMHRSQGLACDEMACKYSSSPICRLCWITNQPKGFSMWCRTWGWILKVGICLCSWCWQQGGGLHDRSPFEDRGLLGKHGICLQWAKAHMLASLWGEF